MPASAVVAERCNGLDDDGDGAVDEDFRDALGRYLHDAHCGACGRACDAPMRERRARSAASCSTACRLRGDASARAGFGPTRGGRLRAARRPPVPALPRRRRLRHARRARAASTIGGERRCTRGCADGCPDGYICATAAMLPAARRQLLAASRRRPTSTSPARLSERRPAAARARALRGRHARACAARRRALRRRRQRLRRSRSTRTSSTSSAATARDCRPLRRVRRRLHASTATLARPRVRRRSVRAELRLALSRSRRRHPARRSLDADRDLDNGCECAVSALADERRARRAADGQLDVNCDGADGIVLSSFYVADLRRRPRARLAHAPAAQHQRGDRARARELAATRRSRARTCSSRPASTPRPCACATACSCTAATAATSSRRTPTASRCVVVAPADTSGVRRRRARRSTDRSGCRRWSRGCNLRGRDALAPGAPAIGVAGRGRERARSTLRDLRVRAGRPGAGQNGRDGAAGGRRRARRPPASRRAPRSRTARTAVLDRRRQPRARRRGRQQPVRRHRRVGRRGGRPIVRCRAAPRRAAHAGRGSDGSAGAAGWAATTCSGRSQGGASCPSGVCCGLADFSVPSPFQQAQAGLLGHRRHAGRARRGLQRSRSARSRSPAFARRQRRDGSRGLPGAAAAAAAAAAARG